MREYSDVVIIGAGASGLLCGGLLAAHGLGVTMVEKNNRVGKKLAATGNGRCNFTNRDLSPDKYYGDREWIDMLLTGFGTNEAIRLFHEIGVYHREKDGYIYPYTNQASTVVDALFRLCNKNGVEILLECKASAIQKNKEHGDEFFVRTPQGRIRCRYVILATGGKASAELGGDGNGYKLARSLGHQIHSVYPGLTGLLCGGNFWNRVAGTRIQGKFSLMIDQKLVEGECGEIQITKDGVSGIPVFQLCRVAAQAITAGKTVEGQIDFVPSMTEDVLVKWVSRHGLCGLVPKKWCDYFAGRAEVEKKLKNFCFPIEATFGMERAQVTAGGVSLEEVNPQNMESRLVPQVFLLGELLDADGRCGGYNLHFAWACAERASAEIRKREEK